MSKLLGFVAYVMLAIFVPEYISHNILGFESGLGSVTGMMVFVALPIIGLIIRDVYRDAKLEVEEENRQIMKVLKDSK